jgi:hypothetical protein
MDDENTKIFGVDASKLGRHVFRRCVGDGDHHHHSPCSMMTSNQNR